jgi:hypothetical protein
MVTSVQGRDTEIAQKYLSLLIETYWHDHSLESSDGTISFSIHPFWGEKLHFQNFSKKTSFSENVSWEGDQINFHDYFQRFAIQ